VRVVEQAVLGATLLRPNPGPRTRAVFPTPLGRLTFLPSPANSLLLNSPSYQQKAMSCVGRKTGFPVLNCFPSNPSWARSRTL
jgi:hypothetical protein